MDWFRVYSSILDKPNVCGLPPDVLGYWLLFMAVANRSSPRGTVPSDPTELGWAIHRDPIEVEAMRDRLVKAGLLEWEGETLRFHKWNLYQPPSTDRATASKATKKTAGQHPATPSNKRQHPATDATQEREREERDEKETPQPPTGGAGGRVVNDSAETIRVCQWANDLVMGWGPLAEGACLAYPAAWVREACSIAHESKLSRFKAVETILGRFKTQGGPDSAQAKGNGKPPPKTDGPTPPPKGGYLDPEKLRRAT